MRSTGIPQTPSTPEHPRQTASPFTYHIPRSTSADTASRSSMFKVSIGTLTGKEFTLDCSPTETIASLKERIQEREGIRKENQQLLFKEKELKDEYLQLSDVGIGKGSRLQMVVRLVGGPGPPQKLKSQKQENENIVLFICKEKTALYMLDVNGEGQSTSDGNSRKLIRIASGCDIIQPLRDLLNMDSSDDILEILETETPESTSTRDVSSASGTICSQGLDEVEEEIMADKDERVTRFSNRTDNKDSTDMSRCSSCSVVSDESFLSLLSSDIDDLSLYRGNGSRLFTRFADVPLSSTGTSHTDFEDDFENLDELKSRAQSARLSSTRGSSASSRSSGKTSRSKPRPVTAISIMRTKIPPEVVVPKSRPVSAKVIRSSDKPPTPVKLASTAKSSTTTLTSSPYCLSKAGSSKSFTSCKRPSLSKKNSSSSIKSRTSKPKAPPAQLKASTCTHCKRRLAPAGTFKCRCGSIFCGSHRLLETHNCSTLKNVKKIEKEKNAAKVFKDALTDGRGYKSV